MDLPLFLRRLAQVVAWTEALSHDFDEVNGNYGTVLRSTNPQIGGQSLFTTELGYTVWNVDPYEVDHFLQALRAAWHQRDVAFAGPMPLPCPLASHGRILCFTTCLTTHDGMAIAESHCFVDESDVPPLDTWFYLQEGFLNTHRPTLFCWIPTRFEAIMQTAMRVEMMESYAWLDQAAPVFYASILRALAESPRA